MHREATRNQGAMQALIGLSIDAVNELVGEAASEGPVSVANHNAETQIVITGAPEPVKKAAALASAQGGKAIPLKVSGAWHSELIRGAEADFSACVETIAFKAPSHPVIHNVMADSLDAADEIPAVMVRQLCSPVRWYDSMCKLQDEGVDTFVEVGPGKVLTGLIRKTLPKGTEAKVFSVNSLKSYEAFLTAMA